MSHITFVSQDKEKLFLIPFLILIATQK